MPTLALPLSLMLSLTLALAGCQTPTPAVPASAPPVEKQVRVNDTDIRYIEQGQGVPVVFVHGSMSDQRVWDAYRPQVAARYRYIAVNQRYFGVQPWDDSGARFSQPMHAADLAAFIQSLGAGPVHVVAWSYGGSVATLAASQHPELFRSLTLHEPTIGSLITGTPEGKAAIAAFGGGVGRIRTVANGGDTPAAMRQFWEFVLKLPPGGFDAEPVALQRMVLDNQRTVPLTLNAPPQPISCEMVGAIRAPALVTVGADTRPLWALSAAAWQRCAAQAELATIPNSNHDAVVRSPQAFAALLMPFLARH